MTVPERNEDQFKYDVAFSFLGQDEAIAVQLNDLLSDRLRTFIYSERQLELAILCRSQARKWAKGPFSFSSNTSTSSLTIGGVDAE